MTTGISRLDSIVKMQKGELVVLASKSSHGTSSFIIDIALHNNKKNKETLIYSYESSHEQFKEMVLKKSDDKLTVVSTHFTISELLEDIKSKVKKIKADMVIVDNIQLIKNNSSFTTTYSDAKDLKNLAIELNIIILVVSKIANPYKNDLSLVRPTLYDLNRNSEFTQFASKVIILYRKSIDAKLADELKKQKASEKKEEYKSTYINSLIDDVEFIVVKNQTHLPMPQIVKASFYKEDIKFANKGVLYIDPKASNIDLSDLEAIKM